MILSPQSLSGIWSYKLASKARPRWDGNHRPGNQGSCPGTRIVLAKARDPRRFEQPGCGAGVAKWLHRRTRGLGVRLSVMQDEKTQEPEEEKPGEPTTDWAGLRAQADKLGITLSQFQQLQFEKKMRLARKARPAVPPGKDGPLGKL